MACARGVGATDRRSMSRVGPSILPRRLRDWLTAELRGQLVPLVHAKAAQVERPVRSASPCATAARAGEAAGRTHPVVLLAPGVRCHPRCWIIWWRTRSHISCISTTAALLGPGARALRRSDRGAASLAQEETARSCCSTALSASVFSSPRLTRGVVRTADGGVMNLTFRPAATSPLRGDERRAIPPGRRGPGRRSAPRPPSRPRPCLRRSAGFACPTSARRWPKVKSRKSSAVMSPSSTSS